MGRTLRLGIAAAALVVVLGVVLAASPPPAAAQTVRLLGTLGFGGTPATLVELDPDTGAIIGEIGPVGYVVNGLTYDETTGKLYGGTSYTDSSFTGLIEIDMTTGAGTPIGPMYYGPENYYAITNLTVNSAGDMFGWTEWSDFYYDSLVRVDKTTGIAKFVGGSYVGTWSNGLSFDNGDVLYMVNGDGSIYEVNPDTGEVSYLGGFGTQAHHGDFHPITNQYFGLSTTSTPRILLACDVKEQGCKELGDVKDLHTLAFVAEQEEPPTETPLPTPTFTPTPTDPPGPPSSVGGFAVGDIAQERAPALADAGDRPSWLAAVALAAAVAAAVAFGGARWRRRDG
jgi:hypothetical protein